MTTCGGRPVEIDSSGRNGDDEIISGTNELVTKSIESLKASDGEGWSERVAHGGRIELIKLCLYISSDCIKPSDSKGVLISGCVGVGVTANIEVNNSSVCFPPLSITVVATMGGKSAVSPTV